MVPSFPAALASAFTSARSLGADAACANTPWAANAVIKAADKMANLFFMCFSRQFGDANPRQCMFTPLPVHRQAKFIRELAVFHLLLGRTDVGQHANRRVDARFLRPKSGVEAQPDRAWPVCPTRTQHQPPTMRHEQFDPFLGTRTQLACTGSAFSSVCGDNSKKNRGANATAVDAGGT